jgi:hypothetical protein
MGTPAMKKSIRSALALSISILALCLLAPSGAYAQKGKSKATAPETYMVVKIGDEYKVLGTTRLKDEEKRIKDEYNTKYKEWQDEKKSDPQAPRPVKPTIKKIKTGYLTQKVAQEYADKLKEEGKADEKPKEAKK